MTTGSREADKVEAPLSDEPVASEHASEPGKGPSKKSVALGAAVGIGSAAIVAALLYTRRR
jgi:hypothetical protein